MEAGSHSNVLSGHLLETRTWHNISTTGTTLRRAGSGRCQPLEDVLETLGKQGTNEPSSFLR